MKYAKPVPLSTDGSFEQIVNAGTSFSRKMKKVWFAKTLRTLVVLMAVLLANILLWLFQVIPSIPSVYVAEILTCAISFLVGRIYEKFSR